MSATAPIESFESPAPNLLVDGRLSWHKSAPATVRSAAGWREGSDGWRAWQKHLNTRERPRTIERVLKARVDPLVWGLCVEPVAVPRGDAGPRALIDKLHRAQAKKPPREAGEFSGEVKAWLAESEGCGASVELGLEALAWTYALPRLAALLPADSWWELLGRLRELAEAAPGDSTSNSVAWLLLAAELPLALAYVLPEIDSCRELAAAGSEAATSGLEQLLGSEGLPRFDQFASLRLLLASWTRLQAMAAQVKGATWNKTARKQYASLVRHALRLARRDATQVFSRQPNDADADRDLLTAAVRQTGNTKNKRIAACVLDTKKARRALEGSFPAAHCEWSMFGLLRSNWSPKSPRLAVGYTGRQVATELTSGRDILWSGPCQPELRFQGERLQPSSEWEEICWLSDRDVDYLELEINLGPKVRIQRQMLLAREDSFLFWADAVLASEPGDLDYRLSLPLREHASFEPAIETHEGFLVGGKRRGLVLPLAMPEWRVGLRGSSLGTDGNCLTLRHSAASARAMFVPLFVDLDRNRFGKPVTWRQLTVAEDRENQPADVAVGYRVQIGRKHWIFYRSFTPPAGRTLLGHHLYTQFLAARFMPQGKVQTLLEIE